MAARKSAKKAAPAPAADAESPPADPPASPAARRRTPRRSEGEQLALDAARFADDTKAEDIMVLDVSAVSTITDFFVLCTGTSMPHLKAIVRDVRDKVLEKHGLKPSASEGQTESQWLVLDYGIVMVHAFHRSKRELYALEDLWSDARVVDWAADAGA